MTTLWNSNFENKTIPFSDTTVRLALATNTVQTFTVPGTNKDKFQAVFSYICTANVFIGYNFTPTVPPAGLQESTGIEEFRPDCRYVKGGDVLSFITPDASAYVGVSLLSIPG